MTELQTSIGVDVGSLLDGRYRLDAVIGEGGMARVFRAEDLSLARTVAVKIMRGPTEGVPARVKSETTLVASLSHPSLVALYDAHISDQEPSYLVMEYVEGRTLSARLAEGRLGEDEVAALAIDISDALHAVHEKNIVHRDVKPSNILLSPSPLPDRTFRAKLTDFGIAYLVDSTRVTAPGMVIGTAAYLAPEQVRGEHPTPAADIYALGLVLLESLTGQRAFTPAVSHEAVLARLTAAPTIPSDVMEGWRALLTAMTAPNPTRRPTALQVAHAGTMLRLPETSAADVRTALEEPTVAMPAAYADAATSTEATALPPTMAIGPRADESHADATKILAMPVVHEPPARAPWRRRIVGAFVAVASIMAVAAIAAGVFSSMSSQTDAPPALPTNEEPLGTHLQELLEAVTP